MYRYTTGTSPKTKEYKDVSKQAQYKDLGITFSPSCISFDISRQRQNGMKMFVFWFQLIAPWHESYYYTTYAMIFYVSLAILCTNCTHCCKSVVLLWTEFSFFLGNAVHSDKIDGLVQECSNSIANALEILQSSTKPLKCWLARTADRRWHKLFLFTIHCAKRCYTWPNFKYFVTGIAFKKLSCVL